MNFILGLIIGAAIVYFLFKQKNNETKNLSETNKTESDSIEKNLKSEVIQVQNDLESTKNKYKKLMTKNEALEENIERLETEIKRLKLNNGFLVNEIEKVQLEKNEYESLYNSKKTELKELKSKLHK